MSLDVSKNGAKVRLDTHADSSTPFYDPDKYVHESVATSLGEDDLPNVVLFLDGKYAVESEFTEAIKDVKHHKDYTALCKLLRTKPYTMSLEDGKCLADLLDGTTKPSRKYSNKETFQKRRQAFSDISFFYWLSRGLEKAHGKGYPIRGRNGDDEDLSACYLASLWGGLTPRLYG